MAKMNWNKIHRQNQIARYGSEQISKPKPVKPSGGMTVKQLESLRSPAGGWTRESLRKLGVPWPPPQGWRRALLSGRSMKPLVRKQHERMHGNRMLLKAASPSERPRAYRPDLDAEYAAIMTGH